MKRVEIWEKFAGAIIKIIACLSVIVCFVIILFLFPYNREEVEPKQVLTGEIKTFFDVKEINESDGYCNYESFVVVEADTFLIKSHKDFVEQFCFLEVKDVVNVYTAGTGIGYLSKQEIDNELIIDDIKGSGAFFFWYFLFLSFLCVIIFRYYKNK